MVLFLMGNFYDGIKECWDFNISIGIMIKNKKQRKGLL